MPAGRLSRSRRRDVLVGAGVAGAAVVALGFAVFGIGPLHLFAIDLTEPERGRLAQHPRIHLDTDGTRAPSGHVTGIVLAVVFAVVFCWLLRRVWRGELDWIDGAGWMVVALLITASSLLPWYVAWLMPLAALAADRRLWRASIVMTGVFLLVQVLGYIPHGLSMPSSRSARECPPLRFRRNDVRTMSA